jgi:hypothetical protein
MRTKPTRMLVLGVAFVVSSCGNDTGDTSSSTQNGGSVGSGGGSVTATGGSSSSATGGGVANPTGGSGTGGVATGGTSAGGTTTVQPEAFELQGTWLYLGPWDGVHTLEISNASMVYADVAGEWSSNWTIEEYDNELDHFQLVFESGTGAYSPTGQDISGTYVLSGAILTVQLANGLGSYPPVQSPGSCTEEGSIPIADCGLYMNQN